MEKTEMKRLKVGDRVIYVEDNVEGEVVEIGYCTVKVKWDDGLFAIFATHDQREIERVS